MLSAPDKPGLNTTIHVFANCHPILLTGRCKLPMQEVVRFRYEVALCDDRASAALELLAYAVWHLEVGQPERSDGSFLLRRKEGRQREEAQQESDAEFHGQHRTLSTLGTQRRAWEAGALLDHRLFSVRTRPTLLS